VATTVSAPSFTVSKITFHVKESPRNLRHCVSPGVVIFSSAKPLTTISRSSGTRKNAA